MYKKGRNVGLLLMFCIMTHTASCNLMSDKRLYFTFTRMSACRGGILIFMWEKKKKARRGTKLFVNKLKRIKIKLYSDFLFTVIESKLYIFLLLIMTEFFNN